MPEPIIAVQNVSHWFGHNHVLHSINTSIERGQIAALVGPSGCGKSTLLRSIIGTHPPCAGQVTIHDSQGTRVIRSPGRDRGIVYQRYSLYPHLTAHENVAFGLMLDETNASFRLFNRKVWRKLRKSHLEKAEDMLVRMKLGAALKKYPPELSGGMCQRVAIAQALVMKPSVLLLDEPFGALDEATREELQRVLLTLYSENLEAKKENRPPPHTIMIVTHEINEAIYVSNRVIGLSQYWDWQAAGKTACPGATIVYDKTAPIFSPGDQRDFLSFREQKEEILHSVFDPAYCQVHTEYIALANEVKGRQA